MVNLIPSWPTRDRVLALVREKESVEDELRVQNRILEDNNIDMTEPLVDKNGAFKVGINVRQVTEARTKITSLQSELDEINAKIDKDLVHIHTADLDDIPIPGYQFPPRDENLAFAVITSVLPGSEGEIAGLKAGDELLQFGWLNHQTFSNVSQVDYILRYTGGRLLRVRLRRNQEVHSFTVTPVHYSQLEKMGCTMEPL